MKKVHGNTGGLKAEQLRKLENLYRRKTRPEWIVSQELARDICLLSHEIQRQIGLLISRGGDIEHVIIGDHQKILIPDLSDYRSAPGRLKGLRCVHTHLNEEPLTQDDLTDLALLRLDLMAAVLITRDGAPRHVLTAHIQPGLDDSAMYHLMPPLPVQRLDIGCLELFRALETEIAHLGSVLNADFSSERALLVSVTTSPKQNAEESLAELTELAHSGGIQILGCICQKRKKIDPRFLLGRGKLGEIVVTALQKGVTLLVFDQELNPSQIRSITDQVDLKVIDRTQLILDIFAQRAQSREGKLQVELAQLKYLLPRLVTKNTAMSRLTGGIGGRGPGETKLEINRRRVRDRISRLEDSLELLKKQRLQQKSRRRKRELPIISIVGYTNAGKSTLLNTLTHSEVLTENRLFATLDPSSRRLRFPRDLEVIITDTVGFIRALPKELIVAFRATLEELTYADLLLHVIDISNPRHAEQIAAVETILSDLGLQSKPMITVLNKQDLLEPEYVANLAKRYDGIPVSARLRHSLLPLIERMEEMILSKSEAGRPSFPGPEGDSGEPESDCF
ncbi:MAG: GTPase HflX [Thermodesulfobacteriota bacterium]